MLAPSGARLSARPVCSPLATDRPASGLRGRTALVVRADKRTVKEESQKTPSNVRSIAVERILLSGRTRAAG